MTMTREEFKVRWESDNGGGITYEDIADCAKAWGLCERPKCMNLALVTDKVLKAAQVVELGAIK